MQDNTNNNAFSIKKVPPVPMSLRKKIQQLKMIWFIGENAEKL